MSTQQLKCREGKALWTRLPSTIESWVHFQDLIDTKLSSYFRLTLSMVHRGTLGKNQELRAGVDPMNFLSLLGTLNKWELAINPFPAKGFPIDE